MAAISAGFRIGEMIGKFLKPISNWIANLKWGSVFKGGLFAGAAGSVVIWWNNSLQTVADATGLTTGQVATCIYVILGVFILYVIYKIAKWRNDTSGQRPRAQRPIVQRYRNNGSRSGSSSRSNSSNRGGR